MCVFVCARADNLVAKAIGNFRESELLSLAFGRRMALDGVLHGACRSHTRESTLRLEHFGKQLGSIPQQFLNG
jgi:hypothetical protein